MSKGSNHRSTKGRHAPQSGRGLQFHFSDNPQEIWYQHLMLWVMSPTHHRSIIKDRQIISRPDDASWIRRETSSLNLTSQSSWIVSKIYLSEYLRGWMTTFINVNQWNLLLTHLENWLSNTSVYTPAFLDMSSPWTACLCELHLQSGINSSYVSDVSVCLYVTLKAMVWRNDKIRYDNKYSWLIMVNLYFA